MTDETVQATSTTTEGQAEATAPAAAQPEAQAPVAPQADSTPDWTRHLETVDPKELRKHPRVAGMIGSEIERAITRERERIQREEGARAAQQAQAELERLAREDPATFSERWLSEYEQNKMRTQMDELRGRTRTEFATLIGQAYHNLPEWADVTPEEHQKLAGAVQGLPDDQVIAAYNAAALDLVANRRASKLLSQWREKELPKERETIRAEERAAALSKTDSPGITRPKGVSQRVDVNAMSDADFDEYWRSRGFARRR